MATTCVFHYPTKNYGVIIIGIYVYSEVENVHNLI